MKHSDILARADALTEAIRAADDAIGLEEPTDQALRIIDALKRMRDEKPARVDGLDRRDYLTEAQTAARKQWERDWADETGPEHDAYAGVDTPIGRLVATTWRQHWSGERGKRIVWSGSYTLNGEPITISEIKAAGLARRPTTRNRRRKNG